MAVDSIEQWKFSHGFGQTQSSEPLFYHPTDEEEREALRIAKFNDATNLDSSITNRRTGGTSSLLKTAADEFLIGLSPVREHDKWLGPLQRALQDPNYSGPSASWYIGGRDSMESAIEEDKRNEEDVPDLPPHLNELINSGHLSNSAIIRIQEALDTGALIAETTGVFETNSGDNITQGLVKATQEPPNHQSEAVLQFLENNIPIYSVAKMGWQQLTGFLNDKYGWESFEDVEETAQGVVDKALGIYSRQIQTLPTRLTEGSTDPLSLLMLMDRYVEYQEKLSETTGVEVPLLDLEAYTSETALNKAFREHGIDWYEYDDDSEEQKKNQWGLLLAAPVLLASDRKFTSEEIAELQQAGVSVWAEEFETERQSIGHDIRTVLANELRTRLIEEVMIHDLEPHELPKAFKNMVEGVKSGDQFKFAMGIHWPWDGLATPMKGYTTEDGTPVASLLRAAGELTDAEAYWFVEPEEKQTQIYQNNSLSFVHSIMDSMIPGLRDTYPLDTWEDYMVFMRDVAAGRIKGIDNNTRNTILAIRAQQIKTFADDLPKDRNETKANGIMLDGLRWDTEFERGDSSPTEVSDSLYHQGYAGSKKFAQEIKNGNSIYENLYTHIQTDWAITFTEHLNRLTPEELGKPEEGFALRLPPHDGDWDGSPLVFDWNNLNPYETQAILLTIAEKRFKHGGLAKADTQIEASFKQWVAGIDQFSPALVERLADANSPKDVSPQDRAILTNFIGVASLFADVHRRSLDRETYKAVLGEHIHGLPDAQRIAFETLVRMPGVAGDLIKWSTKEQVGAEGQLDGKQFQAMKDLLTNIDVEGSFLISGLTKMVGANSPNLQNKQNALSTVLQPFGFLESIDDMLVLRDADKLVTAGSGMVDKALDYLKKEGGWKLPEDDDMEGWRAVFKSIAPEYTLENRKNLGGTVQEELLKGGTDWFGGRGYFWDSTDIDLYKIGVLREMSRLVTRDLNASDQDSYKAHASLVLHLPNINDSKQEIVAFGPAFQGLHNMTNNIDMIEMLVGDVGTIRISRTNGEAVTAALPEGIDATEIELGPNPLGYIASNHSYINEPIMGLIRRQVSGEGKFGTTNLQLYGENPDWDNFEKIVLAHFNPSKISIAGSSIVVPTIGDTAMYAVRVATQDAIRRYKSYYDTTARHLKNTGVNPEWTREGRRGSFDSSPSFAEFNKLTVSDILLDIVYQLAGEDGNVNGITRAEVSHRVRVPVELTIGGTVISQARNNMIYSYGGTNRNNEESPLFSFRGGNATGDNFNSSINFYNSQGGLIRESKRTPFFQFLLKNQERGEFTDPTLYDLQQANIITSD